MMIDILFITTLIFTSVDALTENAAKKCVNDILKWCENKDYSNIGQSSTISNTSDNGSYQDVRCLSNSNGTKCVKNDSLWLECSPDHKATYKGTVLRKNSITGADDEICSASRFVNSNGYQSSAKISKMERVNEMVFKDCFPFCDSNPFGGY